MRTGEPTRVPADPAALDRACIRWSRRQGERKLAKRLIVAYNQAAAKEAINVMATTTVDSRRVHLHLRPIAHEVEEYDDTWSTWAVLQIFRKVGLVS
jgi:hypothetical protein